MAFFDVPADDELSQEERQRLDEYRRLQGHEHYPSTLKILRHMPNIIEARTRALALLVHQSGFPPVVQHLAWMLVAHAKGCHICFAGSRALLDQLGFNEEMLDGICASPDMLPLEERDRLLVSYLFKIAMAATELQPQDFRDMEAHGFSKDEILKMIGYAAYINMHMTFTISLYPAMYEEA